MNPGRRPPLPAPPPQALVGAVNANGEVSNWIGVLVVLLAVTMNMSAVDSLQNGVGGWGPLLPFTWSLPFPVAAERGGWVWVSLSYFLCPSPSQWLQLSQMPQL